MMVICAVLSLLILILSGGRGARLCDFNRKPGNRGFVLKLVFILIRRVRLGLVEFNRNRDNWDFLLNFVLIFRSSAVLGGNLTGLKEEQTAHIWRGFNTITGNCRFLLNFRLVALKQTGHVAREPGKTDSAISSRSAP